MASNVGLYFPVRYHKQPGCLTVTSESFVFKSHDEKTKGGWVWDFVETILTNKVKDATTTPKLRIKSSVGGEQSIMFSFESRETMEKVKADMKQRLKDARASDGKQSIIFTFKSREKMEKAKADMKQRLSNSDEGTCSKRQRNDKSGASEDKGTSLAVHETVETIDKDTNLDGDVQKRMGFFHKKRRSKFNLFSRSGSAPPVPVVTSPALGGTVCEGFLMQLHPKKKLFGDVGLTWKRKYMVLKRCEEEISGAARAPTWCICWSDGPCGKVKGTIHLVRGVSTVSFKGSFMLKPHSMLICINPNDPESPRIHLAAYSAIEFESWARIILENGLESELDIDE